jgi:hypothetical protein
MILVTTMTMMALMPTVSQLRPVSRSFSQHDIGDIDDDDGFDAHSQSASAGQSVSPASDIERVKTIWRHPTPEWSDNAYDLVDGKRTWSQFVWSFDVMRQRIRALRHDKHGDLERGRSTSSRASRTSRAPWAVSGAGWASEWLHPFVQLVCQWSDLCITFAGAQQRKVKTNLCSLNQDAYSLKTDKISQDHANGVERQQPCLHCGGRNHGAASTAAYGFSGQNYDKKRILGGKPQLTQKMSRELQELSSTHSAHSHARGDGARPGAASLAGAGRS